MKSSEAFGHCAPCVEATVQPYRKAVKPANCNNCKAYWTGREDAAQAIAALPIPPSRNTLGTRWMRDACATIARGERPEA